MNKGDTLISADKRVVLSTTNDLLDGTFQICPKFWTQVFIVSAQVEKDCFVPVCYCFLPDKSRISYDTMFSMLKEALSRRGLSLSAEFFMSDFGINICESFMRIFEDI